MTRPRAFITGFGLVSALGVGRDVHLKEIEKGANAISEQSIFSLHPKDSALPVGCVPGFDDELYRAQRFSELAAAEALDGYDGDLDAIVIGVTTGGMLHSEARLIDGDKDSANFRTHRVGAVATHLAQKFSVKGPVLTVSTACSSSNVALAVALGLIRQGRAKHVLAGGADGLCRFTYHGFRSLQLVDPNGARPLDVGRAGMTVAEGAGLFLLSAAECAPPGTWAELSGTGLSCDAHHATTPHPQGEGALRAMQAALSDAGMTPSDIDYVNLHGTGTVDNDAAESLAVADLFADNSVVASSTKGATGHALGAAGAVEAGLCLLAMRNGLVPPNTGLGSLDPAVRFSVPKISEAAELKTVLSNSFGFGGNNASIVLSTTDSISRSAIEKPGPGLRISAVHGYTGAGDLNRTWECIGNDKAASGCISEEWYASDLPMAQVRRLRRLNRAALGLVAGLPSDPIDAIFLGTAWGPQSETWACLQRLLASQWQYSAPMDFVGSVNNAPAGQIAIWRGVKGANITASGRDDSFAQALMMAKTLLGPDENGLVLGLDEWHDELTPRFDGNSAQPVDGGAAFFVTRDPSAEGPVVDVKMLWDDGSGDAALQTLIDALGGASALNERFAHIWVDLPENETVLGKAQLKTLAAQCRLEGALSVRSVVGSHCAAAAVACGLAAARPDGGHLVLGLGQGLTAITIEANPPTQQTPE